MCKKACADCGTFMRVILMMAGVAGVVLGALATTSCSYVGFDYRDLNDTKIIGEFNLTSGSAGLYRIDPDSQSCRNWSGDETDDFDAQMNAARIASIVSFAFGIVGLLLVWMEFACCRFGGSRVFECISYLIAAICIALSALMYSSTTCQNPGKGFAQGEFPCTMEVGTYYAIASFALYIFVCFMLCITPKPEPICIRISKKEKNDPCCMVCRKSDEEIKDAEEDGDDEDQEEPKEEKKSFFGFLFFWRKDKKEEEEEQDEEAPDETPSTESNYHESVAEADEIPTAIAVAATPAAFDTAIEEEPPVAKEAEAEGGWSFWPKQWQDPPQEAQVIEAQEESRDLFFDAAVSETESNGNITAEVF